MPNVTVSSKHQECIGNGVVVTSANEPFSFAIEAGQEVLQLECVFMEDVGGGPTNGDPYTAFWNVDQVGDHARANFNRYAKKFGEWHHIGFKDAAELDGRDLSFMFNLRHGGHVVTLEYSFWLRNA